MPQVSGATAWIVLAVIAVAVGLGVASLLAAFRGEHLDETPYGRHRGAAVLVAAAYLGLAALLIVAVRDAAH